MKKVLIIGAHSRHPFKIGMLAEVIRTEIEKGNDVRYLHCENSTKGYCALNKKKGRLYCRKCIRASKSVLEWNGVSPEKIFKILPCNTPSFPDFTSIEELKNYSYDGYNFGIAPTTSLMSIHRDYLFDVSKNQKAIKGYMRTQYIIIKNLERIYDKFAFDELHTFNGRFALPFAATEFCKRRSINFYLYEGTGDYRKYFSLKNNLIHGMEWQRKKIKELWDNANIDTRDDEGKIWFEARVNRTDTPALRFVENQQTGLLPKDFEKKEDVENIVIFNSSVDEYACFDEFKNPIADDENDILESLLEKYKDDDSKKIYIRSHPNLAGAFRKKAHQAKRLIEMEKKYKGKFIFIYPNSKISSYDLMKNADKVITFISTVGIEATYMGVPSILAGKAFYDELDCVYQAKSMEELFNLIDTKNLMPKPKKNVYPYGYYLENNGTVYKHYKPVKHDYGSFYGHDVRMFENPISLLVKRIKEKLRNR